MAGHPHSPSADQEVLGTLLKHCQVAAYQLDLGTDRYRYVSPGFQRLTGWSLEEPAGGIHPDDLPVLARAMETAREGGGQGSVSYRLLGKDGQYRWLADDFQLPVGGCRVGMVREISQSAQLEQEWREAREELTLKNGQLQALFDFTAISLALFDATPPYTVLAHNKYYQGLWREPFRTQGLVGKNLLDYVPEVEASGVMAVYDEVVRTRTPKNLLGFPYDGMEQGRTWWNWHLSPILKGGEVVALAHMANDVTGEMRALEEAERRAEEAEEGKRTLDALMEYIPEGITIASAPDVVTMATSAYAMKLLASCWDDATGMSMDDWLARVEHYLADGVTPARTEDLPLWKAVKNGEIVEGQEMVLRRPDGAKINVLCNAGPIRNDHILGGVVAWHDITARKRMEERLQEESRRKDDFLAVLGHELRNPLVPIGNAVYLIRKAGLDSGLIDQACTIVENQLAHMVRLVDDLLDVSRIARGKVQLKTEPLDLVEILRGVLHDYEPVFAGNDLVLKGSLPPGPVRIVADRARMIQAVSNLLHNAIKFTDPGGCATLTLNPPEGAWAEIQVQDTGSGIPGEMLASIFEPFTQQPQTIGRARGGLGLGLAQAKGLVEMQGGTVTARSEGPGTGSVFTLRLPLASTPDRLEPPAPEPKAPRGGGGSRILIVEDLLDAATTLRLLLELSGHTVAVAHDGRTGVDTATRFAPEIILCDIGLPGELDGFDVARLLRATPGLERVHLIAMSGYGSPGAKEKAKQAGFEAHLTKPIAPEDLERMIAGLALSVERGIS